MSAPPEIGIEQARKIIQAAFNTESYCYALQITELQTTSFSYTPAYRSFLVDLSSSDRSPATHSTFLIASTETHASISEVGEESDVGYASNDLAVYARLISLIKRYTVLPFDTPSLDSSYDVVPFQYLLTPVHPSTSSAMISLTSARQQDLVSPQHIVLLDIALGQMLGRLHSGVLNEYYGMPQLQYPLNPSYSWQETFTALFEAVLHHLESTKKVNDLDLPFLDLRRLFSRAIAFYLFDDVEVPSLVWFTGSEDDIYIAPSSPGSAAPPKIVAVLPSLAHALWGDPHLESFFLPPAPSSALKEGYLAGGGRDLNLFPRQKTKRLWYTTFLALVVLRDRLADSTEIGLRKREWAIGTIRDSWAALKDAPCY